MRRQNKATITKHKGRTTTYSEAEARTIANLYYNNNLSASQVETLTGYPQGSISRIARKYKADHPEMFTVMQPELPFEEYMQPELPFEEYEEKQ